MGGLNPLTLLCVCNSDDSEKGRESDNAGQEAEKQRSGDVQFPCSACDKAYKSEELLRIHTRVVHNSKLRCLECNLSFTLRSTMNDHFANFHALPQSTTPKLVCVTCKHTFPSTMALWSHRMIAHGRRVPYSPLYQCNHCPMKFQTPNELNTHALVHSNDRRPHSCSHCAQRFRCSSDLASHLLRAHNVGKLPACRVCRKKFSHTRRLTIHLKRCLGLKPYVCRDCPKAFGTAAELHLHTGVAHSSFPRYACGFCGRMHKYSASLDHHSTRCPLRSAD